MNPKLIVEQKITAFTNQYAVYQATPEGEKADMVAFAQQKRFNIKEKIIFYSDEAKTKETFSFRAEKALDIHGRYLVEDENDKSIGAFKKDFKSSLLSSTWHILDKDDQPKVTISESSKVLAIIRRVAALIPFVGDLIELIVAFFRYHFIFRDTETKAETGKYQKTTLFRDHYLLSMTDEAYKSQDWRVLASMAVALDALQSR